MAFGNVNWPRPLLSLSTSPASRQHWTWGGHQAGLEGARLSGHGGAGPLHGSAFLRARAGQGFRRPAAPLQRLVDGRRVSGQVGQLVEDAALPDDGVDQVGVACGRGGGCLSEAPLPYPPPERLPGVERAWRRRGVSTPG